MADRKSAIEAAFQEEEEALNKTEEVVETTTEPVEAAPAEETASTEETTEVKEEAAEESTESVEKAPTETAPQEDTTKSTDRPPQSWKPTEKAKWATIDPTVKQEILRREREVMTTLNDTAQARQVANQLQQVLTPFMPRFQQLKAHPLVAIQELLKADQLLSTSPAPQRAAFMAKLIKDYGVDLAELDTALSSQVQPDPAEAKFEQLFQTRVAPILTRFQQQEMERAKQVDQEVGNTLAEFEDTNKYPYYQQVRGDMADIIELSAKKGVYVTLQQAYNKAVQLDPVISKELEAQATASRAAQANARAQRALRASASVGGAPSVGVGPPVASGDRKALITAAFEASGGR